MMTRLGHLLLLFFVALTASTLLYENHRLMASYGRSATVNQRWVGRLASYDQLARQAQAISDPAGALFTSGDVALERGRVAAARGRFAAGLLLAREDLQREAAASAEDQGQGAAAEVRRLLARVDEVSAARDALDGEIEALFSAYAAGRREAAGVRAAEMNRRLAALLDALGTLRTDVRKIRYGFLRAEKRRADSMQRDERVLAGLILVMVIVVALYGRRAAALERRGAEERERLLGQMRQRNHDLQLVLDNAGQGFLTLDREGLVQPERSAILATWFGPCPEGARFWEYIAAVDEAASERFALSWEALQEGTLPVELLIAQMPARMVAGGRTLELVYKPIMSGRSGDALAQVVLVISDITAEIERERMEVEQRDMLHAFEKIVDNKEAFCEFLDEAGQFVSVLGAGEGGDLPDLRRSLHTLKGNSAIFGLTGIAALCHEIETRMQDNDGRMLPGDRLAICARWEDLSSKLVRLLGRGIYSGKRIVITDHEHKDLLQGIAAAAPRRDLWDRVLRWTLQPTQGRLDLFADQARELARRLGKGPVRVVVESNDLRVPGERWAGFFSAFTHLLRNAVDHGLEPREERAAAGKPEEATILLRTRLGGGHFVVEIGDDGRGIEWERVADRARAAGLAAATHEDLVEALFRDGVSTRGEASEYSGRGVGLAAVRAACAALGGEIRVASEPGRGTTFQMRFPLEALSGPGAEGVPILRSAPPRAHA